MNKQKNNQGVILVLTLIIMSILLATAISFAVFIISDVKQAKSIDDSVSAYYAADAGIEKSLFQFRKLGIDSTSKLIAGELMDSNKASWNVTKSSDTQDVVIRQRLYNGQSIKLFFLGRTSGSNAVTRIGGTWKSGIGSNMQISFTQLTPQTSSDGKSIVYYTDQSQLLRSDGTFCYEFKDAFMGGPGRLSSPSDYVVEIKALGIEGDYIESLKVYAYNDPDDCLSSPISGAISNIAIVSEGQQNKSIQKITAQIPPRDPVSGILSFVLFSEEDITKE